MPLHANTNMRIRIKIIFWDESITEKIIITFWGRKTKNKQFRIQLEKFSFFSLNLWRVSLRVSDWNIIVTSVKTKCERYSVKSKLTFPIPNKIQCIQCLHEWILNTQTNEYNDQISYWECVANTLCNTIFRRTKKSSFEVQSHKNGP